MVPTAIYHHALLRLVLHLLKRKRIADHIAGQLAAALRIVGTNTDCVIMLRVWRVRELRARGNPGRNSLMCRMLAVIVESETVLISIN